MSNPPDINDLQPDDIEGALRLIRYWNEEEKRTGVHPAPDMPEVVLMIMDNPRELLRRLNDDE